MAVCAKCERTYSTEEAVRVLGLDVCGSCKIGYLRQIQEGTATAGGMTYAGFWPRLQAKTVDFILIQLVTFVLGAGIGLILAERRGLEISLTMLAGTAIGFGYPIYFNGRFGSTLGKMMIGARIVNVDGTPIGYSKAAGRTFSEILSMIVLGFGFIMAAWEDRKRALHDQLCGTVVIRS